MKTLEKFDQTPYLLHALLSYLLLGGADTLHHWHKAQFLNSPSDMHAVWLGVVMIPLAMLMVYYYLHSNSGKMFAFWIFLSISMIATIMPGIYHGGWNHFVKLLAHLRIDSDVTDIALLLPPDNVHLWIYEIVGSLEFLFAIASGYFIYRVLGALYLD